MIARNNFKPFSNKLFNYKLSNFVSAKELILQRDQHFRSILLKKEKLSSSELSNVARVLYKNKCNITEEESKRFDDQAMILVKTLDNQELRQVISYYTFTNKVNKFVNYEINQRYKTVGFKDFTNVHVGNDIQAKFYLFLFGIRNNFYKILSKVSGLSFK